MESKKKWTKSNVVHVVISILVACTIWIYVDSADNFNGSEIIKTYSDIPIEYVGEDTTLADRGFMLLTDSDKTITLELKARRFVIAKLDPSRIRIQADLSDITSVGPHSVSYHIIYPSIPGTSSGEFSQNIALISASAYTAKVNVGELYSQNVDIRCALSGNVADGYIAGELQFQPKTLEIRGEKSKVDQVAYAKVTLAVNNVAETVTQELEYELYNAADQLIEDRENLHAVTDLIQVTLPVNVEKELPLKINFVEAPGASVRNLEYSISPASVTVSGAAELLRNVDTIVLDDFLLDNFAAPTTFSYAIPIPEGCENLSGTTRATLTIRYRDMVTATIPAVNFSCENVPDGKTVTVLTTELPVELRGTSADVGAVTQGHLNVVADLTDVTAASGSYTVPAAVRITSGGDVGVVGSYQVRVTISEKAATDPDPGVPEVPVIPAPIEPNPPIGDVSGGATGDLIEDANTR